MQGRYVTLLIQLKTATRMDSYLSKAVGKDNELVWQSSSAR